MRGWLAALGLALATVAAPAHAADPKTLGCAVDQLDAATRSLIEQRARDMFSGAPMPADAAVLGAVETTANACGKLHGWSPAAANYASQYAMATVGLPAAVAEMRKRGLNPDRFAALFDELPREIREKPFEEFREAPPEFLAMIERAQREGLFPNADAEEALTSFLALLFIRDQSRAGFLRS